MKTNLSSQITLTRIPLKYYRPEHAFEHSVLTRLEKIPTHIYESAEEGSQAIAREIATLIRKKQAIGKPFVLALPGGRSPLSVYKELIRLHKEEQLSFQGVIIFVEFEFYPLANPASGNLARLKEELLDHIDIDPAQVYAPEATMSKDAILDFCRQYEEQIQAVNLTLEELSPYIQNILEKAMELRDRESDNQSKKVLKKALEYIEENYSSLKNSSINKSSSLSVTLELSLNVIEESPKPTDLILLISTFFPPSE